MDTRSSALIVTLASLLLAVPVAAQGEEPTTHAAESASPTSSIVGDGARRDLYLDMPDVLGGFEPDIVITRGQEHLAGLDPDDEADARTRAELDRLFEGTGTSAEDMTSGYALVSQEDFFAFVVGVRLDGAERGTMLPAYLPILYEDLVDPTGQAASVGGKDVVVISSEGDAGDYVALYVYDQGDTIWMVQGPEDVVEGVLEALS